MPSSSKTRVAAGISSTTSRIVLAVLTLMVFLLAAWFIPYAAPRILKLAQERTAAEDFCHGNRKRLRGIDLRRDGNSCSTVAEMRHFHWLSQAEEAVIGRKTPDPHFCCREMRP